MLGHARSRRLHGFTPPGAIPKSGPITGGLEGSLALEASVPQRG